MSRSYNGISINKQYLNILILLLCLIASCQHEDTMTIAGYLPDYRNYINIDHPAKHLTDLILFSISPDDAGGINGTCCLGTDHYKKASDARKINNELRILVSIGGGGRSDSFHQFSSSKDSRSVLINELVNLCKKQELNGVDFDWEQPRSKEEYYTYFDLIIEASESFHKEKLMVSVALHAGQFFPEEMYNYVDRIHLMTYDMIFSHDNNNVHHASYGNVEKAIDALILSGCQPNKIVIGLPAYGRHGKHPEIVKTYSEIVDNFMTTNQSQDDEALLSLDNHEGILFDSPIMIAEKVNLVHQKGLRGVFIWEIGQDYFSHRKFPGGLLIQSASNNQMVFTKDEL